MAGAAAGPTALGDRPTHGGARAGETGFLSTVSVSARTVVTPEGLLEPGTVEVDDGLIVSVEAGGTGADGAVLAPGFVDLQVNGHDDVDCASAAGADWDRMDELLLAQGVTTWCPTLVTQPLERFADPLGRIAEAAARPGRHPSIAGAHLEGPFLGGAPGAHRREHIKPLDLGWLAGLPEIVRVVTLAPEIEGAPEAIRLLVGRGILVSLGHSTASYEQALAGADAGARLVTHLFNGMGPLHHRSPGLVGAALHDRRLTPSLIADGVHVHPAVLGVAFAATDPVLVTDAVGWRQGNLGEGRVAMVDGAPRLSDGTIAGSALTMDAAIRRVVQEAGVPLARAIEAAATRPAALLGLDDRGALAPGRRADLVLLTPELTVDHVLLKGA